MFWHPDDGNTSPMFHLLLLLFIVFQVIVPMAVLVVPPLSWGNQLWSTRVQVCYAWIHPNQVRHIINYVHYNFLEKNDRILEIYIDQHTKMKGIYNIGWSLIDHLCLFMMNHRFILKNRIFCRIILICKTNFLTTFLQNMNNFVIFFVKLFIF